MVQKKYYYDVRVNLRPEEYEAFHAAYSKTACKSISEYGRKLIFRKPVTVYYRDRAVDELVEVYIQFKKDLAVLLEKKELSSIEIEWIKEKMGAIKEMTIKIYEHVRKDKT